MEKTDCTEKKLSKSKHKDTCYNLNTPGKFEVSLDHTEKTLFHKTNQHVFRAKRKHYYIKLEQHTTKEQQRATEEMEQREIDRKEGNQKTSQGGPLCK